MFSLLLQLSAWWKIFFTCLKSCDLGRSATYSPHIRKSSLVSKSLDFTAQCIRLIARLHPLAGSLYTLILPGIQQAHFLQFPMLSLHCWPGTKNGYGMQTFTSWVASLHDRALSRQVFSAINHPSTTPQSQQELFNLITDFVHQHKAKHEELMSRVAILEKTVTRLGVMLLPKWKSTSTCNPVSS